MFSPSEEYVPWIVNYPVSSMHTRLLAYTSRHIDLSPAEADYFVSLFKHRQYLKRQFVLQAGDICRHETFIVSGCLRAYFVEPSGSFHIVQFAVEDWWTADLKSLWHETPATLNIDALETTDVLQIEKSNLDRLFREIPKTERMFRVMLTNAFIAHQQRIIDNLCKPAAERYLTFLERYGSISQRVPQAQIASYLGMTPEFLSQVRRNLMW